ncbi:hypothetical protein OROHE_012657 [Orobanche hederae]
MGVAVKPIARPTDLYTRERSNDLQRVHRNLDPSIRPQEKATELVRALNAAKLDKIFARPYVWAMDGHIDGISSMAKNPKQLKGLFSGSMDGDIRLWDLANRRTICKFAGHNGAVRGLTVSSDGRVLVSCGTDATVKLWSVPVPSFMQPDYSSDNKEPLADYTGKNAFWAVDHQWGGELFATAGAQVDIWNHNRHHPVNSFEWGKDTAISVRFNPGEPNILAASASHLQLRSIYLLTGYVYTDCFSYIISHEFGGAKLLLYLCNGSDRSITIYDLRVSSPAIKIIMRKNLRCSKMFTKTNSIAWNPIEPMNFTAANEDSNCYSYDARKLRESRCVHKDHVSAVMDIDYSPTGREFVTGSYDRSIRIFPYNGGHSREVYHTKRMQRVFCVKFSGDGSYVISGSDDTNVRLWKAKASEQMGVLLPRERRKHAYDEAVKKRYRHLADVKRIDRHRHLPRAIYKAASLKRIMADAERTKQARKRAHSAPGSMPMEPLRKKRIVKVFK